MTLNGFSSIIDKLEQQSELISNLYSMNIDLTDFVSAYDEVISTMLKEEYGAEGLDWWNWYCYENRFGKGSLEAWDENNNKICYDVESLWKFMEDVKKKNSG